MSNEAVETDLWVAKWIGLTSGRFVGLGVLAQTSPCHRSFVAIANNCKIGDNLPGTMITMIILFGNSFRIASRQAKLRTMALRRVRRRHGFPVGAFQRATPILDEIRF
jgi:hypothetical protein